MSTTTNIYKFVYNNGFKSAFMIKMKLTAHTTFIIRFLVCESHELLAPYGQQRPDEQELQVRRKGPEPGPALTLAGTEHGKLLRFKRSVLPHSSFTVEGI